MWRSWKESPLHKVLLFVVKEVAYFPWRGSYGELKRITMRKCFKGVPAIRNSRQAYATTNAQVILPHKSQDSDL